VLGGTFDPVHWGHLALAEAARECAALDRVLLVPAAQPPHRPLAAASAEERLEMCRLAAGESASLDVSDLEVRRRGPSYTVDTLRELAQSHPHDQLFLVLGWDAARDIGSWRQPDEILALASLVIVPRPGLTEPGPADLIRAGLDPSRVVVCERRTPDVRATEVRRLAAAGRPLDGLVPRAVERYLRQRRLYRSERA
jgi:nicotinate-nucleotide adenylyltransferase